MSKNAESRFTIRAIDKTQRVFAGIRKGLNGLAKHAKIFAAGGALAFAGFASNGLQAADALAKMSDQSQLATESVQAYRLAMELAGGSSQGLDKAIVQMNKNIGIAIRDGGSYERVFESLGLKANELASLGTDEAFERIGEEISKLPTAAEKSAAALQIFGRQGREMLTLFKDGRGGIDAARKDIDELGLAMSRVDAAKVEIANDQLTRMRQVGRGASQLFAAELAPIIDDLSSRFLKSAKESGGLSQKIQEVVTIGVKGFAQVGNVLRGWEVIVKGGRVLFAGYYEFILDSAVKAAEGIEGLIKGIVDGVNEAIAALNKLPKVDIDMVSFEGFETTEKLRGLASTLEGARKDLQKDLGETLDKPLPTVAVEKWLEEVRAVNQQAAEEIAATSAAALNPGVLPEDIGSSVPQGPSFEDLQKSLGFNRSFQLPTDDPFEQQEQKLERIKEDYELQRETILEAERLTQEQRLELLNESERRFLATQQQWQDERSKLIQDTSKQTFDGLLGLTEQFAGKQSGIYKAMFAISKAFAIKDAIVSIQQGIANAAALPFPANLGAMATVAASTAGIVSNIQGTQLSFEGGGSFRIPGNRSGGADGRGGVPFMAHPGERVQVTDLRKGNQQSAGEKTVIQNITINGRLTEAEKRETIEIASELGAQKADAMIASTMRSGDGETARTMEDIYPLRRGVS